MRNRPPGLLETHFPVMLISVPIWDGSARNDGSGSWVVVMLNSLEVRPSVLGSFSADSVPALVDTSTLVPSGSKCKGITTDRLHMAVEWGCE